MKTVLVTGGAEGIGLAISQELISEGWNVVITGRDVLERRAQWVKQQLH